MAFRDADTGTVDARRVVWRWMREFWLEDWGLKLLALLITLVLWVAVTGQRTPATINLRGVQVEYLRPDGVEISNEPLDGISVTLQGSRGKLDEINARSLVARIDITQLRPGERRVYLTKNNVRMDLPEGIEIVRVEPSSVALRLERSVEREIDVEARLEGNTIEGFEVRSIQITPSRVRVRGPESRVATVERAHTETISLDGQRETLTLPQIAVDIADRMVVPVDPVVSVRVEIAEASEERRIQGVSVRALGGGEVRPAQSAVTVRGPRSIIERLRAEELEIVLEQMSDGSIRPRLAAPPAVSGRVELVGTTPAEFSVTR